MEEFAKYKIEDFKEGMSYSYGSVIAKADVDAYAVLSGDVSPLHMDDEFAIKRGFKGRLVHGGFLAGYISRLVGIHFPGENAMEQSLKLNFVSPVYVNDRIRVTATVEHVSLASSALVLDVVFKREETGERLIKGKIQIVFTNKDTKI